MVTIAKVRRPLGVILEEREGGRGVEVLDIDPRGNAAGEDVLVGDRVLMVGSENCAEEGFDASLVLNRHTLVNLAAGRPTTVEELAEVEGLLDWQVEFFARELVELVQAFEDDLAAGRLSPAGRRGRRRR